MSVPYPGVFLQEGQQNDPALVKLVQAKLGVWQTGVFGPTTEECVVRFQTAHGLTPDGEVGPKTWAKLFNQPEAPATSDLGRLALEIARAEIGVREVPLGSNRGPRVNQYHEAAGTKPGDPWCMAFVFYCVAKAAQQLGIPNPLLRTGSCSAQYRHARKNGLLSVKPEPGDIFLVIGGDTGHRHTGFVDGPVNPDNLYPTVEGNSNSGGSAEGIGVVRREPGRRLASCHYIRL